ncbi:MAG: hypothetical protein WBQ44_05370, partial [Rhodococcus sp. (in: high G+C Gram-positive bacteria)]
APIRVRRGAAAKRRRGQTWPGHSEVERRCGLETGGLETGGLETGELGTGGLETGELGTGGVEPVTMDSLLPSCGQDCERRRQNEPNR